MEVLWQPKAAFHSASRHVVIWAHNQTTSCNYKQVWFHQTRTFSISGSGSWPQREGLLCPAARQIYRRNFPPVGLIQSRKVLLRYAVNHTRSRHMKCDLNRWWYPDFVLSPVFKYKAFVGVLSSLPRSNFPGSLGARKHYRLVLDCKTVGFFPQNQ